MEVASLDIFASEIETRDHTFLISPSAEWLAEQVDNFMRGVGIKANGKLGKLEPPDWTDLANTKSASESDQEEFMEATIHIF